MSPVQSLTAAICIKRDIDPGTTATATATAAAVVAAGDDDDDVSSSINQ